MPQSTWSLDNPTAQKRSARLLQAPKDQDQAIGFVQGIIRLLTDWLDDQGDRVSEAALFLNLDGLEFYVTSASEMFDVELNNEFADLIVSLAQDGFLISGMSLPLGCSIKDRARPNSVIISWTRRAQKTDAV